MTIPAPLLKRPPAEPHISTSPLPDPTTTIRTRVITPPLHPPLQPKPPPQPQASAPRPGKPTHHPSRSTFAIQGSGSRYCNQGKRASTRRRGSALVFATSARLRLAACVSLPLRLRLHTLVDISVRVEALCSTEIGMVVDRRGLACWAGGSGVRRLREVEFVIGGGFRWGWGGLFWGLIVFGCIIRSLIWKGCGLWVVGYVLRAYGNTSEVMCCTCGC